MAATPRQPETAASAAQPPHPETGEQERPKRLPGLWIICVVIGLCGMFWVSMLFLATLLGLVLFGAVALLHFAVAVGLWRRLNFVRIVLMVLLGIACILLAVGWATDPLDNIVAAVPFSVSVAVIAYLWFRRRPFKLARELKPRLGSAPVAVAGVMVLVLGMGWILLLTVDDGLEHFPQLEVHRVPVADHENAFLILQEMRERFPIEEDEDLHWVLDGYLAEESLDAGEWDARAAEVVHRWEECLQRADDLLAGPALVLPVAHSFPGALVMKGKMDLLVYCRRLAWLLSLEAKLEAAEGRPEAAMRTAEKIVDLGLLLADSGDGLITYLTGCGVLYTALEEVREIAQSEMAPPELLLREIGWLELMPKLKTAVTSTLRGEFAYDMRMFRALTKLHWDQEHGGTEAFMPMWQQRMLKKFPFLKLNMTQNLVAGYVEETIGGLGHYQPDALRGTEVGLVHRVRNPIGAVFVGMSLPALGMVRKAHFGRIADARMTQVFLALRCYHLENGRLPEELDELTPGYFDQVPVDPFTEQLFRYEPDADPPRLVSLGPDQTLDRPDAWEDDRVVELTFAAP